jgi:PAS domain S-box-containing protein
MAEYFGSAKRKSSPLGTELQATFNLIPAHVWYAVPSGVLTFLNERASDYLGLPKDHPLRFGFDIGAGWDSHISFLHPDDHEETRHVWSTCLKSGRAGQVSFRLRNADGSYRWFLSRSEPVQASDGTILYWIGVNLDIEDQKGAEFYLSELTEELQRRQAYLAEAQKLSRTGSFGWNVAKDEHYWSDETFRIFEFAPSSKVSLPMILERVHPQDMPSVNVAIAAANKAEGIDLEFRLLMPDGRIKYLHVVAKAERGKTGSIEVIGAVMDVTARKLTEVELRRSKAHLTDAQKLSRTGSVGMEVSTKRIFWSEEAARIYGYPPGTEPTADLILQRAHPDDVGLVRDALERAAQSGNDFDYEHRLLMPDGSIKHLHDLAHRVTDEAGNEEVVGAIMDITEGKRAEEELRQMLDFAPQLIAVYGPNRERIYANRVALDYSGLSLDDWRQTKTPGAFTHPDDRERERAYFAGAGSNGSPGQLELRIRARDGSYRWFLVRYNAVRDHGGPILRWYVSCTDIEDQKRAEERLQQENVALREEIDETSMFEEIVGTSPALQSVLSRISKVAPSDSTVLITGETGTGKELVARAIHRRSSRGTRAFVSVNCAAIPRDLILSELFGHEKGAFTGATQRRLGRFELANNGTIFLDEVGELSSDTQVALLRVLQEREFERVGGSQLIHVDVRVIAATNRDLKAAVANGTFRQDLFYRLNVFPVEVPPLRERKHDILMLAEYFVQRYAKRAGKNIRSIDKRTLSILQSYDWPGNIRELQNIIERSVILSSGEIFSVDETWLSKETVPPPSRVDATGEEEPRTERSIIEAALAEAKGRISGPLGAAVKLGIPPSTLDHRIKALKIDKTRFKFN